VLRKTFPIRGNTTSEKMVKDLSLNQDFSPQSQNYCVSETLMTIFRGKGAETNVNWTTYLPKNRTLFRALNFLYSILLWKRKELITFLQPLTTCELHIGYNRSTVNALLVWATVNPIYSKNTWKLIIIDIWTFWWSLGNSREIFERWICTR
jgi:hypothetical protein